MFPLSKWFIAANIYFLLLSYEDYDMAGVLMNCMQLGLAELSSATPVFSFWNAGKRSNHYLG